MNLNINTTKIAELRDAEIAATEALKAAQAALSEAQKAETENALEAMNNLRKDFGITDAQIMKKFGLYKKFELRRENAKGK